MAVEWFDDFSWYRGASRSLVSPYLQITDYAAISGPEGAGKDWAARMYSGAGQSEMGGFSACAEYWAGEEIKYNGGIGASDIIVFMNAAGTVIAKLCGYADGSIAVVSGHATGVKLAAAPAGTLSGTGWITTAARVKANDGAGEAEIWVNGFPVGSANTLTIKGVGGETSISRLLWRARQNDDYYTHIWAVSVNGAGRTTRLQRPRCVFAPVTGDTAVADYAKSTGGTGYVLIDEAPPNFSDYIDGVSGNKSKFTVTPVVSLTGKSIVAVKAGVTGLMAGAGGISQKTSLTSNGNEVTSAALAMSGTQQQTWVLLEHNPDGDVAWTPATAAAVQVGAEAV